MKTIYRHKRMKLALAAGLIMAFTYSATGYSASQGGGVCKAEITTTATAKSKNKALSTAVDKWQQTAQETHNVGYSKWDKAKSKSKHCTAVAGKWPNQTFTCVIAARPCP